MIMEDIIKPPPGPMILKHSKYKVKKIIIIKCHIVPRMHNSFSSSNTKLTLIHDITA